MMESRLEKDEVLECLAEEFTLALRAGQHPSIKDYQLSHPEWADEIDDLLSSIALLEQVKGGSFLASLADTANHRMAQLTHIGDYEILREIGRGGMGVVFAAQHRSLGRKVAIKVLSSAAVQRDEYVIRFRREAQAAARLHHTNIVSVYGAGECDGFYYYIMDLVEGLCLSEVVKCLKEYTEPAGGQTKCPGTTSTTSSHQFADEGSKGLVTRIAHDRYRWTAVMGVQIADALSYAHSKNILHRDIKPANIMLDHQGTVWITDFGLAKDFEQQADLTKQGDVVGTPQYLAPESLEGQYDLRSEVYGVGLVLYELATLSPAHGSGSPGEILRAVATHSPSAVRRIDKRVPRDLATIIDKALSKDPWQRYANAEELRQDLMGFTEGRAISARRPGLVETSWRWAQRNPLAAVLAGISCLLLSLVAVSASVGYVTTAKALSKEASIANSLRQQQRQTESARLLAEENLSLMEAQYQRAEANVGLTIQAFDEMFKAIFSRGLTSAVEMDLDGYREISGIETAVTKQDAEFLKRMVTFYEQFVLLNSENENLREESARAYRRLGNIYQLVGQMLPAIEAYEKSLEYLPSFDGQNEIDTDWLMTRVRTQNELSSALRRSGSMLSSQQWYRRSIQMLEQADRQASAVNASPELSRELRLELARTLGALGFNITRAMYSTRPDAEVGEFSRPQPGAPGPRAFGQNRQPPQIGRDGRMTPPPRPRFPRLAPPDSDREDRRPIAANRAETRGLEEPRGGPRHQWVRQNKPYNYQAIEILDALIQDDPDNPEIQAVRATCYWNLAAATMDEDRSMAIDYRTMAIESLERLVELHPDNSEYKYLLALACGLVLVPMDLDDLQLLDRGTVIIGQLVDRHPSLLDYQHLHANLRIKQASYHLGNGQPDVAMKHLQSARSSVIHLMENVTTDRSLGATIGMLQRELQELQSVYRQEGNLRRSHEITSMIMQIRRSRNSDHPLDPPPPFQLRP